MMFVEEVVAASKTPPRKLRVLQTHPMEPREGEAEVSSVSVVAAEARANTVVTRILLSSRWPTNLCPLTTSQTLARSHNLLANRLTTLLRDVSSTWVHTIHPNLGSTHMSLVVLLLAPILARKYNKVVASRSIVADRTEHAVKAVLVSQLITCCQDRDR